MPFERRSGLTLACARCHDHKFDPLLSRDYYSLVSILAATRNFEDAAPHVSKLLYKTLATKEETDRYQKAKESLTAEQNEADDFQDQQIDQYVSELIPGSAEYMLAARRVYRDKADVATVSQEKRLRPDVLKSGSLPGAFGGSAALPRRNGKRRLTRRWLQ